MKIGVACAVLMFGLAGTVGSASGERQRHPAESRPVKGFERFQEWARLAWAHTPGQFDSSARIVAAWPAADLFAVKTDLWAVVTLINGRAQPGTVVQYTVEGELIPSTRMGRPTAPPRSIRSEDVPDLIALPGTRPMRELDEAAVTSFLKRAAILHSDIVFLSPIPTAAPARPRSGRGSSAALRILDGLDSGWEATPIHWEFGRTALEGLRRGAANEPLISAWYRATSAYQEARREYGFLAPHLEKARAALPKDAQLQLYSGVMHEAHAAPVVQSALRALSSRAFSPTVKSAPDELKMAEGFFRRALDLDPSMATARVHLGRVLGLLGRHDQAAAQLRQALSVLTDARQRYLAELFLGAQEQALGRESQARAALERASLLFPNAQSPYLALSQLAWQSADRTAAQAAFQALARLPEFAEDREDPWWLYDVSTVLDVSSLVNSLMELAAKELPA